MNAKTYWLILKIFDKMVKILIIPPILGNNKLISNFEGKAN